MNIEHMKKNAIIIGLSCVALVIAVSVFVYVTNMKREMVEMEQERTDYEFAIRTQILSVARSYLFKHPTAPPNIWPR